MTKTYAILQKKLQELELQLSHNNLTTIIHPSLSQEFHQKFLFVANLLSAEIASCPTELMPRRLRHMARRLAQLEAGFWSPDMLADNGHVNDSSTCWCTESCLNDDSEVVSGSSCLEDEMEGGECFYECVEGEKEEKEERKIVGVGKLNGAMASGFVIGMVLMGVAVFSIEFFGYFQVQQNGGFVIPT
ncbi:hypothetical protein E6C27_scaffold277G003110 [Cucumis melo var. makuwa]|uniref:DUF7610 domain-containing protein n=1 Tax=Cucumis melo var. makuwa TaxID=1194695 RepID=A0A5A7T4C4_CUCMM|nr:hypothetical protein E6C27_scaffold277G003110 [Cucumis melo var. makuwa]